MYTITKKELLKQIEEAQTPAVAAILTNHLNIMEGKDECVTCGPEEVLVVEDVPVVEDAIEEE